MIVAAILTFIIMTIGVMIIEAFQKISTKKKRKRRIRPKKSVQETIEKMIVESHIAMTRKRARES
jgi:hypothetical protein